MNLKIWHKLLLTFVLSNFTVLAIMVMLMQWNFGRGFLNYINQVDAQTLERLLPKLEEAYATEGNWDFLRRNYPRWYALAGFDDSNSRLAATEGFFRGNNPHSRHHHRLPPPRSPLGIATRISLVDTQHRFIVGSHRIAEPAITQPITHAGEVVGYLRMTPLTALDDLLDLRFVQQQTHAFYFIALALLGGATLLSMLLARQLVAPIKALAAGTRLLAAGRFNERIPVYGNDELARLAADFNSLAQTLERNEQARRQWLADISHELRTPLTILRGEIQAIEDGVREFDPAAQQSLSAEVERLSTLVDDLYELSLSDSGALSYRKERIDVVAVLNDTLSMFAERFEQAQLAVEAQLSRLGSIFVLADAQRLFQLFSNILENSLRYTHPGGRIGVRIEKTADAIMFHFEDSAPAVPAAALARLFDRFYRVDSSRSRASGGAGLGLAICKNIVAAHNGDITAQASPMGGLWVRVRLPYSR